MPDLRVWVLGQPSVSQSTLAFGHDGPTEAPSIVDGVDGQVVQPTPVALIAGHDGRHDLVADGRVIGRRAD
ncbi:MAG: hypothetical protein Ct9H300mP12_13410 [Acidimicrobiales bacterium]|nr:MAG: hypothetical protein Ct9H300mP12_13410 [Acidimicrobiales bacterium]